MADGEQAEADVEGPTACPLGSELGRLGRPRAPQDPGLERLRDIPDITDLTGLPALIARAAIGIPAALLGAWLTTLPEMAELKAGPAPSWEPPAS